MQVQLLNSGASYIYANKMLILMLVTLCSLLQLPTNASANGEGTKGKKPNRVIDSTPSIGPDNSSVIGPSTGEIKSSSDDIASRSHRKIAPSIGQKPKSSSQKETIALRSKSTGVSTISPSTNSIAPSSNTISSIKPSPTKKTQLSLEDNTPVKPEEKQAIRTKQKRNSLQLIKASYDNTPTKKPASILEMFSTKMKQTNNKDNTRKLLLDDKKADYTATSINWLTWEEAMKKHAKEPRKIVVELYTNWCSWCVKMDKTTFKDPAIIQYINENFYAVKFDAETREEVFFKEQKFGFIQDGNRGYNLFSLYLTRGRLTFPSIVFLDESINNPQPVKGFQNVTAMERLLQFFGENHYRKMDWSLYNKSIESAAK